MASLNTKICTYVAKAPRASSEIYDHFEDTPRTTVKAAVSKLVKEGSLFRPKINLAHGNSIITDFSDFEDARLLKKLYQENFYGRETIRLLLEHMQFSQPSVSLVDIAKIAVLRIGKGPAFDWESALALADALVEIGAVRKEETRDGIRWVLNKKIFAEAGLRFTDSNANPAYVSTKERIRADLAKALGTWLMHNGFVSPGYELIDNAKPVVSYALHPFDFLGFAFSKGVAIRQKASIQPKSFVGDIIFEVCSPTYAKAFKARIDEVTAVTKEYPIPFILAKGYTFEAFAYLKKEGILTWTIDQLMGKKTAEAIEKTLKLCELLVRKAEVNPKLFLEALDGLENFGSLFGSLKGKLFEILIAYFFSKLGYENIQIGRPVPFVAQGKEDREYDLDVYATRNAESLLIECKGIPAGAIVEDSEVTKHFNKRSPQMRDFILRTPQNKIKKFRSIIVTSGDFSADAERDLQTGKLKSRPDTSLELWNRERLLAELEDANQNELIDVLTQYFKKMEVS